MTQIPATRPKSPLLGRHRNKSCTNTDNSKSEKKIKNICSTGNTKTENKDKSNASTGISITAKETLNRIIKRTKKALSTSKETMKLVVSKA